jgi:hypothetical protein
VGVRFNLEPRVEAARQQNVAADFILNGVGAGEDLILQTADDWRGNFPSKTWDGSVTGYYVHPAARADCSVQFEGGLPNFTIQGVTEVGAGTAAVAADPVRDAFFVTDVRFGSTAGIGVFRASASDLLNPANCPDGTHLQKQAESCWMQTLPLLLNPVPQAFYGAELGIAVDERKTGAGTGAGDVYLVASAYVPDPGGGCRFSCSNILFIVACTNSLKCGPMLRLTPSSNNPNVDPVVHVRQDGAITISHGGTLSFHGTPTEAVDFVTCTPVGAPSHPCAENQSTRLR